MHQIDSCIVCGEEERTIVSAYNRLVLHETMWQNDLARFNYALCHGCGLVYATRRPEREEYDFLYENFNEFLDRRPGSGSFNQPQVSEALAAEIDRDFLPWWEVKSAAKTRIRGRLQWELEKALKIIPYFQHVPLDSAKVLHIRAKDSTLADMLKRLRGATQVDLITLFPPHKYMAEKNDSIRVQTCLDYEDFKIPFEEKYHLIIENHVLLHMLDANRTFEELRSHLEDGGRLFLTGELTDDELFRKRKNLLAELRPFHYQHFDIGTLDRILRHYGFEPEFLTNPGGGDSEITGLATLRRSPEASPRIDSTELDRRIAMYRQWHDESILALPRDRAQALYGDELETVLDRIAQSGGLEPNKKGVPKALRALPELKLPLSELAVGAAFAEMQSRHPPKDKELARGAKKLARDAKKDAKKLARDAKKKLKKKKSKKTPANRVMRKLRSALAGNVVDTKVQKTKSSQVTLQDQREPHA